MKSRNIILALMILITRVSLGQETNYSGSFTAVDQAGKIAANIIKIKIQDNSHFTAAIHLRENKVLLLFNDNRNHADDYTDVTGTCTGTVNGQELNGSFQLIVVENEVGTITRNTSTAKIKATINGKEINGQLITGAEGEEDPMIIPFRVVESGNELPELIFPAGKSPKVFDKGWIFGAVFSLLNEKGELVDLSDKVEWKGSASFTPMTGKESRPEFKNLGANKIILSVTYEGKTYKNEYPVDVVSHLLYGHTGTLAFCNADSHGCPACPHKTIGVITTGSSLIMAGQYPAARVGDKGFSFSCCGGNYFTIRTGDNRVLIEGIPAAEIGAYTTHCGGEGNLVGGYSESLLLLNDGGKILDNTEKQTSAKEIKEGDILKTNLNGIIAFPANSQTGITLFPQSILKVLQQTKEMIKVFLEKGQLLVNGNTQIDKKVLVSLKDFSITPAGTKFWVNTDSSGAVSVFVYDGKVTIQQLSTGKIIQVDSGYSFRYTDNNQSVIALEADQEMITIRGAMSAVDSKTVTIDYNKEPPPSATENNAAVKNKTMLQQYGIYIAVALIVFVVFLVIKRKKAR
ncbi:MAG: PAAR domain-containing protein [Chitinophagaceae bacterium]|nr:PAAR domain-containing protein [Chitinophagaceae bacterium]